VKLKFTLRSAGEVDTDLVATVDATTTVGQLAEYLVAADPSRGRAPLPTVQGQLTLSLVDEDYRAVDPRATIAESGLRSGVHVAGNQRHDQQADEVEGLDPAEAPARRPHFLG
jgi:S-DNA-T family DNA segregation ATPase FtsK/SpoIIIE